MTDSPDFPLTVEPEAEAVLGEESADLRRDRRIVALLGNFTQEKAAAALGISTVALWRRMQQPEFSSAFRKARREAVSLAVARLQQATGAAVATLLRVMADREAPASSRIGAADIILQDALRGMEIEDIEARVRSLSAEAELARPAQPDESRAVVRSSGTKGRSVLS